MTSARNLDASQARRIALRAQGFGLKDRTTPVDRGHLRRLMARLRLIQLDSVPVILRTQYMPGYSRLGPYDNALFDDVAYHRDEWMEGFIHEACVVPMADEPIFRFLKDRARRGEMWKGLYRLAQEDPDYVEEVLQDVRDRGPMKASELSNPRPQSGEWWGSRSLGSVALDYLFRVGEVGIRRVGNFEKEWDLTERIVPAEIRSQPGWDEDDAMRELLVRSAQALGLGTQGCLVDYFRLPKKRAGQLLRDVVEEGRLVECRAEGVTKPVFLDPDAVLPRQVEARAFLSPFDPVVWNRPRGEWLFDFEYKIEIYVPQAKRRYGYYVLPFLLGDRLVGRCDMKTDRDAGVLRVLSAFVEPGADQEDVATAMADELPLLARHVGVDDLSIEAPQPLGSAIETKL
ncbi:MAG: crosslink repair DNA glycosylase YcaQ family protein [Actinomycetota bacterium]